MIPRQCIEVQTSPVERPSVPPWLAEVAILAQHLATKGLLEAFTHQIRLVRGHFGHYEPIDFLVLLIGYAISGERRLSDQTSLSAYLPLGLRSWRSLGVPTFPIALV